MRSGPTAASSLPSTWAASRGFRLLPRAFLPVEVGLVAGVVDEEGHVREQLGGRADVSRGRRPGSRARYQSTDALVDGDDPGPAGPDPLEERQAHLLVVEVPTG